MTLEEAMTAEVSEAIAELALRRKAVRMEILSKIKEELEAKDAAGYHEVELTEDVVKGENPDMMAKGFLSAAVNSVLHLENIHIIQGAGSEVKE